jgi:hypothetical protein
MTKKTSLLTKNTGFEHKYHFDMRKWQKRQNVDPGTHEIRIDVWHAEGLG